MLWVYWKGGRAKSQPEQQGCASGGISGASDSKEGSANACRSLRMGFLCKVSILLFSFFNFDLHVTRLACLR